MTDPEDGPWDPPTEHDPRVPGDEADAPTAKRPTLTRTSNAPPSPAERSAPSGAAARRAATLPPPVRAAQRPAEIVLDAARIVVVATGSDAERILRLCKRAALRVPIVASLEAAHDAPVVVIGEPSPPAPEHVIHVVRPVLDDERLLELLRALAGDRAIDPPPASASDPRVTDAAEALVHLVDRAAIEARICDAIKSLVAADRAYCLFHDPSTNALWSEAKRRTTGDARQAVSGLAGFAVHARRALHVSPAGDDPRWLPDIDDPEGKPQSRLLVQPVFGADGRGNAVLIAVRRWRHADFTAHDAELLAQLAARAASALAPAERRPRSTIAGVGGPSPSSASQRAGAPRPDADMPSQPGALGDRPDGGPRPPAARTDRYAAAPTAASAASSPTATAPSAAAAPSPTTDASTAAAPSPTTDASTAAAPSPKPAGDGSAMAGPLRRHKRPSTEPARLRPDDGDLRDVAVVAAEADQVRIAKLARKSRLELSTFPHVADAPLHYRIVALGDVWSPEADKRIDYIARTSIADDQLVDLVVALARDRVLVQPSVSPPQSPGEARRTQIALDGARRLANAPDLAAAEEALVATLSALLDTDRSYCLFYDPDDGSLWSERRRRSSGDERRAIAGIVGWAVRTGRAVSVARASADPRWLAPIDDPDGDVNGQLLVQPVIGANGHSRAVLIAARRAKRPGFGELDQAALARVSALASPQLEQLHLRLETQQVIGDDTGTRPPPATAASSGWRALAGALPRWAYAALGALLMLIAVAITRC